MLITIITVILVINIDSGGFFFIICLTWNLSLHALNVSILCVKDEYGARRKSRYEKHLYHQSQYSNTWDRKCLALIAEVVRAFGIKPKLGG